MGRKKDDDCCRYPEQEQVADLTAPSLTVTTTVSLKLKQATPPRVNSYSVTEPTYHQPTVTDIGKFADLARELGCTGKVWVGLSGLSTNRPGGQS